MDQGTTSSRTVLFDQNGRQVAMVQKEIKQIYPHPGWVEHCPDTLFDTQLESFEQLLKICNISPSQIAAIGITNQRETSIVWEKSTGKAIYNAIVWQDTRTTTYCEQLKSKGLEEKIKQKTGLLIDSYFSAPKISWILDNVPNARAKATNGELLFGTVDSWLIWRLTRGTMHLTDYSNASRSLLYNISELKWDSELLQIFDIPSALLPKVRPSSGSFGVFEYHGTKIPIGGVAGDQQAALFGQACFNPGEAKNTYGTGCFLLMNTGEKLNLSNSGLLSTIAWGLDGTICYAMEGTVFNAGAAIQWLRDGLGIIKSAKETQAIAESFDGDNPVYFVPAFAGLGAPYWDMNARGAIFGLTRDTDERHLVRAALEAMAYRTKDLVNAMHQDCSYELQKLKVDGGASANDYLMQFQADILEKPVARSARKESTAFGAAGLAAISIDFWDQSTILSMQQIEKRFLPRRDKTSVLKLYKGWQDAVRRIIH